MLGAMLRMILIINFISVAWAGAPARAEMPADAQQLRRAVALLDYVSGDYARAVGPQGEVLSEAEYREQIGFVEDAAKELRADTGDEDLARQIDALRDEVAGKAPPTRVASQAKALRDQIVQKYQVVMVPQAPPDLSRGAHLYAQACAACHGADGHPVESLGLLTRPPDFAVVDEVKDFTPQRVFNAATYGVPNTQMPAYDTTLSDAERWDIAFFLLTLAHPHPSPRGLDLARAALVPTHYQDLAALSDAELRARLARSGLSAAEQEEALAALRAGPFSEASARPQGLAQARRELQKAVAQAHAGDRDGARRTLISAYLDHFEPHEAALRARDGELVREIESAFLAVRGDIDRGGPGLDAGAARLDTLLERADARGPGGALVAFVAALAIALREGVEAALVVAAMLALLRKSGRVRDAAAVHLGWTSALLAGAATWWVSGALLVRLSGAHRELVEGVLQLVTAALLLYASHWLLASLSAKRLVTFLSARTLAAGSAAVVMGLTWLAVYREMFEVVLFFRGLLLESPGAGRAVALGALVGLLALVALVALFQRLGKKLRPRPLLLTCGILLCGLAVLMVGNGVRSLQVLGVLPLTVWGAFQLPALGVYATREGLLAQALVLLGLIASALWSALHAKNGAPKGSAPATA
ncbi:MAG: c-type cytochrome [Deltaproteobacteria bacterium]|nr:MAG: c-type cytochrome [Deltaproteobacteria bacterium]